MTTDFRLKAQPRLDPDGAVRVAIWGTPDAKVPVDPTADSLVYDEVTTAIECWDAYENNYEPGNGIDHLDRRAALEAAQAEARRFRSYC